MVTGAVLGDEAKVRWKSDLPSPLHSHHEQEHSTDRQETTQIVDLGKDLFSAEALAVDTGWREVEDRCDDQSNERPESTEETDPSPR